MSKDSTFDLSFDSDFDEFDPLADVEEDNGEGEEGAGQGGEEIAKISLATDSPDEEASATAAAPSDTRTPSQRTSDLLKSMAPRRKVLLGILSFCIEPQPVADVNDRVDVLQQDNFSVYTAANLCALLEKAGAIERVTQDGEPADNVDTEPKVTVVDGVEYLEAAEPVQICWVTTEAGREALDADKPLERLRDLLDSDAAYAVIYKRILTMCSKEGGQKIADINAAVDNDPLVQKPRLYAPHFVDKLEKCDALEWHKAWATTDIGREGLNMLADVVDTAEDADKDDDKE